MNNKNEIEIKKILLSGLQKKEYPLTRGIEDILNELLLLYNHSSSHRAKYLDLAVDYCLAYLQLGFSYLNHKELFDSVFQEADFNHTQILLLQKENKKILINRAQIRSLIGRWPNSSGNSHTILTVVEDIIYHASNNDLGVYDYYTAKKDGTYTAFYQVTVSEDCTLFHDVFCNKFYRLIKE